MPDNFTHLHLHSEFSFLDGYSRVWDTSGKKACDLIDRLKEVGQKSCAITDHGSTSGWVRFEKACNKNGIQPIFGVEGYYCRDRKQKGLSEEQKLEATRGLSKSEQKAAIKRYEIKKGIQKRAHFVALAMNQEGVYEILKSMSIAATEGFYYRPRWDFELIKEMKNCIFSTACAGGILNYYLNVLARKMDDKLAAFDKAKEYALKEAAKWKRELGDRLYIELMSLDWDQQKAYNLFGHTIAKELDIPEIITNDCHYSYPQDAEAHDILLAIQSNYRNSYKSKDPLNDPNRMRYSMKDLYVKNRDEMRHSFLKINDSEIYDVDGLLDRTQEVSERCHTSLNKKKMIMPSLNLEGNKKQEEVLKDMIKIGWDKKVVPYVPKRQHRKYLDQIKYEFQQITKQGFTPYFILCNKLMKWVDSQGIARGPARGSSAGSLVAYLLDIVMVDPIPHKLLFSRFIDPNRTDYPDVDMDFEDWRRREIIQYFIKEYGENNVAILGNNMTYKPKMALKDVARLYRVPMREVQELCNLSVERSGADSRLSFCLEDMFKQFEFAQKFSAKYPEVAKFAAKLEGRTKVVSTHAAGVIIGDGDIRNYTSLRKDAKKPDFNVATIDVYDAADIGLLKMDILGLNTLAILQGAKDLIKQRHGKDINFEEICRDTTYNGGDNKVYKEFAAGNTVGIFQFNSPGLTRLVTQVKIEKFQELADCTALHRPGPIHGGSMSKYPGIKHGKIKKHDSLHEIVKEETDDTYGLVVYQEQVMQVVRRLGGFNWAQTNEIRKVMSKSGGAEYFMTHFWPTFKDGCAKHDIDEKTAMKIFKRMVSFGCLSGDTKILNPYPNQSAKKWVTLRDLYNWDGFASPLATGSKAKAYVKMQSYSYTKGRLKPNRICRVFCNGTKELFEIKTENGNVIKASADHRFVCKRITHNSIGYVKVADMIEGKTYVAVDGGYCKGKKDKKGHKINWELITSIKSVGVEPVYDIEMEDRARPTYVANGFVSHNSWAFNKSHAVSYAFVSYICMWLKVHYPIEFCTAYLNRVNDTKGTNIKAMVREVDRLGIEMKDANVNISKSEFTIAGDSIVAGMSNVKNVGAKAVATIVENAPYDDMVDFLQKIDNRACNKRSVENLVKAGAFRTFGYNTERLLYHLPEILKHTKKGTESGLKCAHGILNECKGREGYSSQSLAQMKSEVTPVSTGKHLCLYYDDVASKFAPHVNLTKLENVELDEAEQAKTGKNIRRYDAYTIGLLTHVDLKRLSQETKEIIEKGEEKRYALANLEDETDFIVLSFREDVYYRYEQELFGLRNKVILVKGVINKGWKKCYVNYVYTMDDLRNYLLSGRRPLNFGKDYLFQHPLERYFDKTGGLKAKKKQYGCRDLTNVRHLKYGASLRAMVFVKEIQTLTIRNPESKYVGHEMYWVFVEDETYNGSFMIHPGDSRFNKMKKDIFEVGKTHEPFIIHIQKDMKYDYTKSFKQVNLSIHKKYKWEEVFKRCFKMVKKGGGK